MDAVDLGSASAGAYYSRDFEWETLRREVESTPAGQQIRAIEAGDRNVDGGEKHGSATSTSSSWEAFHQRHSRNLFFKERRYLVKEFPELIQCDRSLTVLEIGCGTGSSVISILRANTNAVVYACDCSAAALQKATEVVSSLGETSSCSFFPFLCDISVHQLPVWLCCSSCRQSEDICEQKGPLNGASDEQAPQMSGPKGSRDDIPFLAHSLPTGVGTYEMHASPPLTNCCVGGVDIVTLIFTLSAVPLERMSHVLAESIAVLRPGGLLLFRDYGLYDMTMLRFPPSQHIGEHLYQREDGTLCHYFSLEGLRELFTQVGFLEDELEYCCVQLVNRRKQVPMKRVWIHAKFHKTST